MAHAFINPANSSRHRPSHPVNVHVPCAQRGSAAAGVPRAGAAAGDTYPRAGRGDGVGRRVHGRADPEHDPGRVSGRHRHHHRAPRQHHPRLRQVRCVPSVTCCVASVTCCVGHVLRRVGHVLRRVGHVLHRVGHVLRRDDAASWGPWAPHCQLLRCCETRYPSFTFKLQK